jgi:hypothetical protein
MTSNTAKVDALPNSDGLIELIRSNLNRFADNAIGPKLGGLGQHRKSVSNGLRTGVSLSKRSKLATAYDDGIRYPFRFVELGLA